MHGRNASGRRPREKPTDDAWDKTERGATAEDERGPFAAVRGTDAMSDEKSVDGGGDAVGDEKSVGGGNGEAIERPEEVRIDDIDVLLVDDDEAWVRSMQTILEHQRGAFDVTSATDLNDAREALAECDPDCVVCDYRLVDATGLDFLAHVREIDADRPFLLVTGEGSEAVASDAINQQVTDYLRKRTLGGRGDTLARRIESAVRTHRTERALARERRSKEAMLDIVTATTSRTELARDFCQHLVTERAYDCAWIGTDEPCQGIVPRAVAGDDDYLQTVLVPGSGLGDTEEPARVALDGREPHVVRIPAAGASDDEEEPQSARSDWRAAACGHGFREAAAVPIEYDGTIEGVLSVYTSGRNVIDSRERELLGEYAGSIGYAMRTAAWKQSLVSAARVIVDFQVGSESAPLVGLDRELPTGATVEVLTMIFRDAGLLYVLRVTDASPETIESAAGEVDSVRSVRVDEETGRCELVVSPPTPEGVLAGSGARVVGTVVEHGRATVTTVRPEDEDVQTLADHLRSTYPDAEVSSVRSKPPSDRRMDVDDALGTLTEKQRQAIELAFYEGYFERPREHNTTEVAAKLDVNRATFTQHLRAAERKLLSQLLEPSQ